MQKYEYKAAYFMSNQIFSLPKVKPYLQTRSQVTRLKLELPAYGGIYH